MLLNLLKNSQQNLYYALYFTYPTPDSDANLSAINDLQNKFKDFYIGFSDHTLGIEIPVSSVAFGARIIEKHLHITKN